MKPFFAQQTLSRALPSAITLHKPNGTRSLLRSPYSSTMDVSCLGFNHEQYNGTVGAVYIDFDDTIAEGLTVPLQLKAVTQGAAQGLESQEAGVLFANKRFKLISEMTVVYEEECEQLFQNIVQNYSTGEFNRKAINQAMKECREFDEKWIREVIASKVFGGVSEESFLAAAVKTPLKSEVLSVLSSFRQAGMEITVMSINWSAKWIQQTLQDHSSIKSSGNGAHSDATQIFSNEMIYEDGVSTGDVTRVMWSGEEKAAIFKELTQKKTSTKEKLNVFIGDSYYDIQPLLMADIGIIMGGNEKIFEFARAFGIQTQPLKDSIITPSDPNTNSPVLYYTTSWSEIADVLLSPPVMKQSVGI